MDRFPCLGRCGVEDCEKTYIWEKSLRHHLAPKLQCTICPKKIKPQNMAAHKRKYHPELVHTIQVHLKSPIADKKAFYFVKKKTRACLRHDKTRAEARERKRAKEIARRQALGIGIEDMEELVPFVMPSNHVKQEISIKIHDRWSDLVGDDAGGFVKPVLESFNIFQLTLERNCNTPDHFVDNGLSNISLVILGINNAAVHKKNNTSLTGTYGKGTVAELKRRRNLSVDLDAIMTRESKPTDKRKDNVVYQSCNTAYKRDKKTQAQFGTAGEFFTYGLELLRAQGARCAISDIPMEGHKGSPTSFFQPSLDAIDPTLGHVKGNLRWVILCLNATDRAKQKKAKENPDDSKKSRWTKQKFLQYIGVRRKRKLRSLYGNN